MKDFIFYVMWLPLTVGCFFFGLRLVLGRKLKPQPPLNWELLWWEKTSEEYCLGVKSGSQEFEIRANLDGNSWFHYPSGFAVVDDRQQIEAMRLLLQIHWGIHSALERV